MDGHRFDELTRIVRASTNRRLLAGGVSGLVAGLLGLRTGDAAPVRGELCLQLGKRCRKRKFRCCGRTRCRRGRCRCNRRQKRCGKTCIAKARCCGGCEAPLSCHHGACVPTCGDNQPCIVFTTRRLQLGALGGIESADSICTGLAGQAGLPGEYKPWLSDSTTSPSARFMRSPLPYQLPSGTRVAANWAALTSGPLDHPIDEDEHGDQYQPSDNVLVWTNTTSAGHPIASDGSCDNWTDDSAGLTGAGGSALEATTDGWTSAEVGPCSTGRHMYCFQQT